jgi:hypothetical protein
MPKKQEKARRGDISVGFVAPRCGYGILVGPSLFIHLRRLSTPTYL